MTKEQKEQIKPSAFIRGKKVFEEIGNEEIGTITIERKGSLTIAEKLELETMLEKANFPKLLGHEELIEMAEMASKESGRPMAELYMGIMQQDIESLACLDNESFKKLMNRSNETLKKDKNKELAIYACTILRSRVEEFQTIIPEDLLNVEHPLFLPYPLLKGCAEFCNREFTLHQETRKFVDQDDLKSLS